jgi:hypothetical protein
MVTHKYQPPLNVIYCPDAQTSKLAIIFSKRNNNGLPAYLVYNIEDKVSIPMVPEEHVQECTIDKVVDYMWNLVTYTGDNGDISSYIIGTILKNICTPAKITWGPNDSNTEYSLNIEGFDPWVKQKTA